MVQERRPNAVVDPFDIFGHIIYERGPHQGTDGTVLAEVRDLRRYLLLVEAEMMARGACEQFGSGTYVGSGAPTINAAAKPKRFLTDGVLADDMEENVPYISVHQIAEDVPVYIVDRAGLSATEREQFMRLPVELNAKEHEEIPAYYKGLYDWNGDKYRMQIRYMDYWGKV